jgi:hypothetical protein
MVLCFFSLTFSLCSFSVIFFLSAVHSFLRSTALLAIITVLAKMRATLLGEGTIDAIASDWEWCLRNKKFNHINHKSIRDVL